MHYCNLQSDFLHHEAGEFLVLRTIDFTDSAFAESNNGLPRLAFGKSRNDEKNQFYPPP
ncbi:hypothetical protein ACWIUD_03510 [Helicobacter sp. 23-1044]